MMAVSLTDGFERALGEILTRVRALTDTISTDVPAIAVAYSGGLDSSVLLHLAQEYASTRGITLFAFHIHHGISPNADHWLTHCQNESGRLGVTFDSRRINLKNPEKNGTEEAARKGRYAALGDLCRGRRVSLLLTAHHQDDQAETVLLQLLRGSGVAGLSGMDTANLAPDLLGGTTPAMARPLLTLSRKDLENFAVEAAIPYVDDESNLDPRYARNALRHNVMPILAQAFPGFQERFARTAQHAQSAQRLLIELASQDLAICLDGDCIGLSKLRELSPDRIDNLLRYWFGSRGVRMPSTAWLSEMRTQLLDAKSDAQLCVTHADCHIRRHRDRVFLTPRLALDPEAIAPQIFRWKGESQIQFPLFDGVLHIEAAEDGIATDWLQEQDLIIRFREGGERMKLASNRPTKALKYHYQALDVPAWERTRLPIIATTSQILFAAGIGMDCHQLGTGTVARVRFRWQHGN